MRAAWTWLRLSYGQQRWEVLILVIATAVIGGGMLWLSNQVESLRAIRDACLAENPQLCDQIVGLAYEPTQNIQLLLRVSEIAPFAVGIVLGAPLVAREVDGRTAQLAWTLSRSRTRWLMGRIGFTAVVAVVCLGVLAWTSEVGAALLDPTRDLTRDFNFADTRGPILVARGIATLAIAVLVGTLVGRLLPSLLAAILVIAGVFIIGLGVVDGALLKAEAQVVRIDPETGTGIPGDYWVDSGLQLTDGTAVTWDEATRRGVQADFAEDGGDGCWFESQADVASGRSVGCEVAWVIAGDRYPEVTARRFVTLIGLGFVAVIGAVAVVNRRRPV